MKARECFIKIFGLPNSTLFLANQGIQLISRLSQRVSETELFGITQVYKSSGDSQSVFEVFEWKNISKFIKNISKIIKYRMYPCLCRNLPAMEQLRRPRASAETYAFPLPSGRKDYALKSTWSISPLPNKNPVDQFSRKHGEGWRGSSGAERHGSPLIVRRTLTRPSAKKLIIAALWKPLFVSNKIYILNLKLLFTAYWLSKI